MMANPDDFTLLAWNLIFQPELKHMFSPNYVIYSNYLWYS